MKEYDDFVYEPEPSEYDALWEKAAKAAVILACTVTFIFVGMGYTYLRQHSYDLEVCSAKNFDRPAVAKCLLELRRDRLN